MVVPVLLLGLLVKFGPVLINEVVAAWKDAGEPSPEEIQELASRCPPPTHFFPDAAGPGG